MRNASLSLKYSGDYYFFDWSFPGGADIYYSNDRYTIPFNGLQINLDPFTIVYVRFSRNFNFIETGSTPVIPMPTFALAYLLQNEENAARLEVVNFVFTAYSIFTGVGEIKMLAKNAGSWEKLILYSKLLKEVANVVLDNEDVQVQIIATYKEPGRKFLDCWRFVKNLDLTSSTTKSIISVLDKNYWFNSLYDSWNVMNAQNEHELKRILGDGVSGEITKKLNELNSIYGNEEIIY